MKSIEKLDFSDNLIDEFPFEALKSQKLKYLNLRSNRISLISSDFIDTSITNNISMIDISDNKLRHLPYKFFKIFPQSTNVRLGNNPYCLNSAIIPSEYSLTEICISKMLRTNKVLDSWVDRKYGKKNVCDFCDCKFVVNPYHFYIESFFDPENKFVVEKTLCSFRCLNIEGNGSLE